MIKIDRPECPHPQALANQDYKHPLNKEALKTASSGKCMYCESKVAHIDYADIEHIKPKAEGRFPELQFEWTNLGYSCTVCNNKKRDKFYPEAPFLDPYVDEPSDHLFAFGAFLFQKNGSERGEITIKEIELNRPALVEQRTARIEAVSRALDACFRTGLEKLRDNAIAALKAEAAVDKEYSAIVSALLNAHGL